MVGNSNGLLYLSQPHLYYPNLQYYIALLFKLRDCIYSKLLNDAITRDYYDTKQTQISFL